MASSNDFPHLQLTFREDFAPRFIGGAGNQNAEVKSIQQDPESHAKKLRTTLDNLRHLDNEIRKARTEQGLPPIPAGRGFLIRLPEGIDVEAITKTLGVELVAETDEGYVLVSTEDVSLTRLEEVLTSFETSKGNKIAGSSLLDIYEKPDDEHRLQSILAAEVLSQWPFVDGSLYTFDLGIQTASTTRMVKWPIVRHRKNETLEEFQLRKETSRKEVWSKAEEDWLEKAEVRINELNKVIQHYQGEFLSGMISDPSKESKNGIVFPDSVQVRIRLNGQGLRDIVLSFPHLFEVAAIPEIQSTQTEMQETSEPESFELSAPAGDAPAICIIDSGTQEQHKWLAAAIDSVTSFCFLPGKDSTDVADYVQPSGHGTRVAGAVLFPLEIPKSGQVKSMAWIQNARVLDENNKLPDSLPPEVYLYDVVKHFGESSHHTRIFNHSINSNAPCPRTRMTAWAAKLDQLSHENDILFIQSAGNQSRWGVGDQANPGLQAYLDSNKLPPEHLFEKAMRVANPAQSLHALTVGSISANIFEDANRRSFAKQMHEPSGFSRAGFAEPWSIVKPEVVELGGDLIFSKTTPHNVSKHQDVSIELLNSTLHGSPAYFKDGAGTSFSTPKVSHLAARLQTQFPTSSPLLYRALIVQSARWPAWAESNGQTDKNLRTLGYGLPSVERATQNSETRVTLITPDSEMIASKQLHLYTIRIPEEMRNASLESQIRIDITLAYTALPRRTRARRTGYLETWLDWETSKLTEPLENFVARMKSGGASQNQEFPWTLHKRDDWGQAQGTNRNRGTVQKDWAILDAYNLPNEIGVAVRAHKGWNHLDGAGFARYCLVVSFEALDQEIPIYSWIQSEVQVQQEVQIVIA